MQTEQKTLPKSTLRVHRVLPLGRGWKSKPSQSHLSCKAVTLPKHCRSESAPKRSCWTCFREHAVPKQGPSSSFFIPKGKKSSKIKAGWGPGCASEQTAGCEQVRVVVVNCHSVGFCCTKSSGTVWICSSSVCKTQTHRIQSGGIPKERFLRVLAPENSFTGSWCQISACPRQVELEALSLWVLLRTKCLGLKGRQSREKGSQCYMFDATWVRLSRRRERVVESFWNWSTQEFPTDNSKPRLVLFSTLII